MIPKNITKEHLEKAIEEIDKKGVRKGRHSSTYDLIYNKKSYPPKLVISIANRFANGSELDPNVFAGGKRTAAFEFLKKEGFEIIPKNDPTQAMIENYKIRIAENHLKGETYKWELVNQFRGRPNPNAVDFYQEIKEVKFNNLIYAMGMAVINHLAKDRPEELRQLFISLYDETKDLTERIKSFNKDTLKIYRELGQTLQHHQDERTIATYLTFHDSDKYTFYKYSFYKKYCKLLGIKEAKKNEKYPHYLTLIDELIEKYIEPDSKLIEQVKRIIPQFYDGTSHKLLAQDILFQMLDNKAETRCWIFQGNPKVFDFETALRDEILTDWTVSAHKDKIKVGDKVILWITGNQSGCYALAEVISEPHQKTSSPDDHLWKGEDKSDLKADIKITHNLVDTPILKEDIESLEELNDLKVGNQGTNFSATEEEYQTLLDLISSNENSAYESVKKVLDPTLLSEFITYLRNYVKQKSLQPTDDRISFNVRANKNRLVFIIGNRYAFCIEKVNKKTEVSFIYKSALAKDSVSFTNQKKEIEAYWNKTKNIKDFEVYIKDGFDIELNRNNKNPFRKYTNKEFIKDIYQSNTIMGENNNNKITSLNTILYGPPGTGKTHILKNQYMDLFTSSESSVTRQDFLKDIIQNCSWWQVIALAVLELGKTKVADIFKHEYVQVKAELSNSTTITPTIWGQLQSHTIEECAHVNVSKRMHPMIFNKTEKSEWEILLNEVEEQSPELLELKLKIENFESLPNKRIERFEFLTFHQSYSYEDFIEGIKPELSESDVSYKIEEGVFQKMCNRARNDSSNNYAIFIDEINRGNISSIFGELITLIEDDKREGKPNEIRATLPYSKKHFSVPNNLYIIGTMNTADRSVEALDTALRRRFSFIEMNPNPAKLNTPEFQCTGIDLEALLNAINARIEKLLDKDYCIGHSYFMSIKNRQEPLEEIQTIFQNKILPLLQEYFYGDWGKILLVIGKEFVEVKKNSIKFLSTDSYEDFEEYDEKPIYNFTKLSSWTLDSFKSIYE
jgi:Cdc6-like AAA superfamily ATPase